MQWNFGSSYAGLGIGKTKIPKNRHLRKEHPVWILLLRANAFSRFIFTSSVIPAGIAGIQLPWMAINTSEASPQTNEP